MYNVIVLGATFAAAGIAHQCRKNCLVIERRVVAGYEFFGALHFGSGYDTPIERQEAQTLQQRFQESKSIYRCETHIYPYLQQAQVLFGTEIVSVQKTQTGFACVTHNMEGFHTYTAKMVIDTRCNAEMCTAKTFPLLIASNEPPLFSDVSSQKTGVANHYVLPCPVPLACDYAQARTIAQKTIRQFTPNQRLILLADEFDYQVKEAFPKTENEICFLPSKAYKNPVLAFEAGLLAGEEAGK